MKLFFISLLLLCCLLDHSVFGESLSAIEGDTVTLHTGVETNQQEKIRWYYNDTRIAQIHGDQSRKCTDVQCNKGTETFRDRLKLDHQTGSLTIINTRTTDSGRYTLKITTSSSINETIFNVIIYGFSTFGEDVVLVFVMEGDSVMFQTGVKTNQQGTLKWYYNNIRIAQINGDLSRTCTDVRCNKGTERFQDRLKLDNYTGSLIITNIRKTDFGVYQVKISSRNNSEKTLIYVIRDVSAAKWNETKTKSAKEGESVTIDPGEIKILNDSLIWYFKNILIADITGDPSKACTDNLCTESFRNRLKVNHITGSLTITNTTTTDSGDYHIQINSSRISIIRSFNVSISAVPDPGPPLPAAARTYALYAVVGCVFLLVVAAVAACVISKCLRKTGLPKTRQNEAVEQCNEHQENGGELLALNEQGTSNVNVGNGSSYNQSATSLTTADNGLSPKRSRRMRKRKRRSRTEK